MHTPRLAPVTPEHLTSAQRVLYESITTGSRAKGKQAFALTSEDGALRGPFNAMLYSPRIGSALEGLGAAIRYESRLSSRSREIAILLVATRWTSAFEREAHEAVARTLDITEAQLEALRREDISVFEGIEHTVGCTAAALLDGDLDDDQWRIAVETLGADAVFDLTALIGYYTTLALQLRVFRV